MPCYESEEERQAYRDLFKKEGRYDLAFTADQITSMLCDVMRLLTPEQLTHVLPDIVKFWEAHKKYGERTSNRKVGTK